MKKGTRIFLIAILVIIAAGCINAGVKQDTAPQTDIVESSVNDLKESEQKTSDEAETNDVKEKAETDSTDSTADDSNESADSNETAAPNETADSNENAQSSEGSDDVDVDLTAISGILVYSEVYNMMGTPQNYLGKKIKMEGIYAITYDSTYENRYDACIVQDATACCATGIEFELSDELKFPDDYPEEGDIITVEGVFDTYDEGSYTYCTLRNASLLKVEK